MKFFLFLDFSEHKFGETVASVQTEERTYYYTMEWKDKLIDSRSFYIRTGHHNPKAFPIESRIQIADHVHIGHIELGSSIKDKFTQFIELTADSRPEDPSVKLHSGLYYHCMDMWNPELGDIRIQFSFAGLEGEMVMSDISVILLHKTELFSFYLFLVYDCW